VQRAFGARPARESQDWVLFQSSHDMLDKDGVEMNLRESQPKRETGKKRSNTIS
jgi:hypothetical protein